MAYIYSDYSFIIMDIAVNYWWIGALALGVIILLIWVARRDQKDEKQFEKEIIDSELTHEKHDGEEDKEVRP